MGRESCQPFMTWPQKKRPWLFRKCMMSMDMERFGSGPKIGSMLIRIYSQIGISMPDDVWSTFLFFFKLNQIAEPCFMPIEPRWHQQVKSLFLRYFCCMILLHELVPNKPLQRDFISTASPKQRRSIIPHPPLSFGRVILGNLVKWNFFLLWEPA